MKDSGDDIDRGRLGPPNSVENDSRTTGLPFPGLRTWRGVYLFVLGVFALYVLLLTVFEKVFP